MSSCSRRSVLAAVLLGPLIACGFEPVYSSRSAARAALEGISLGPVEGRMGFAFREAFETRIIESSSSDYRVDVKIRVESEDRVIRQDNSITRFSLTGFADYAVFPANSDQPVLTDQIRSATAYSATANSFATRVAERDAEDRLAKALADAVVLKLTATAARWSE